MAAESWSAVLEPLGAPRFRKLFLAQSASFVGDRFTSVALAFAVLRLTGSATDLGLVLTAQTIPLLLFIPVGGVIGDRLPRNLVMVASDLTRVATQTMMAALLIGGYAKIWQLVVLQALHGVASAFFYPASTGLVPETTAPGLLQKANGLLFLTYGAGGIAGPIASGVLVAAVGPGWAIGIDAVSFAASALWLWQLGFATMKDQRFMQRPRIFTDLADGWREVTSRPWLLSSIVAMAVFQFATQGPIFVLGPLIAQQSLGGAPAWGLVIGAFSLGSFMGAVMSLRIQPQRLLVSCFITMLFSLPSFVFLALVAPLWLIALSQTIAGLGISFAGTLYEVVLQQHVPRNALSRVAAYDRIGSTALRPIGMAITGPLARVIGIPSTMLVAAGLVALSSAAALMMDSVRRLVRVA